MLHVESTNHYDLPMPPGEASVVLLLGGLVALLVILDQYYRSRS